MQWAAIFLVSGRRKVQRPLHQSYTVTLLLQPANELILRHIRESPCQLTEGFRFHCRTRAVPDGPAPHTFYPCHIKTHLMHLICVT